MDTIINRFRGLSRGTKITIIIALLVFTPIVSIVFSIAFNGIGAAFSIIGFVFSFVNWGIAFMLLLGYGAYIAYRWINSDDAVEEDNDDNSWDPFK